MRRYALHDDQWERIKDLLPGRKGHVGTTAKDNRLFVEAVLWRYRSGAPWRDLPERFGDWNNTHRRFSRWAKTGVWKRIQTFSRRSRQRIRDDRQHDRAGPSTQRRRAKKDAMGRAARTMAPSSLQRINGAPHATAERFEQIPRNSRTRCNTNRRDRDGPVELAGRRYRAWRRALAVEEARGR